MKFVLPLVDHMLHGANRDELKLSVLLCVCKGLAMEVDFFVVFEFGLERI